MQFDFERVEGEDKYLINISIPPNDVDKEIDVIAKAIAPRVQVKGFRQGNAPVNIVKAQYRPHIRAEVSQRLVYNGVTEAMKDPELRNVFEPTLLEEYRAVDGRKHLGKFGLDGSFSFALHVQMPPEIELKDYKGIEVEVDAADFDGWFKKKMHQQQMMYGDIVPVDRPAQNGDECVIVFEGHIDGKPLPGGKEEGYRMNIGERNMLPEFEDAFIGKPKGEDFEIDVRFPDDYPQEHLRGKDVRFVCQIQEISENRPHPLNDELAELLSYENLDKLEAEHREMFEEEFSEPLRAQMFNNIMDSLLELHPFEAPNAWVERELQMNIQRLQVKNLRENEHAMNTLRETSVRTVKVAYLLEKIYEVEESIHLTPDEFKEMASEEAAKHKMTVDELLEKLRKEGTYEGFVNFYEQQKVIDFLIEHAVVKEKE